jgi:hypothetical protein
MEKNPGFLNFRPAWHNPEIRNEDPDFRIIFIRIMSLGLPLLISGA